MSTHYAFVSCFFSPLLSWCPHHSIYHFRLLACVQLGCPSRKLVSLWDFPPCLVCLGGPNKEPQTGGAGLTQRKCIFSQFWRREVQDLGVSGVRVSRGCSPWPVGGLPSVCLS